MRTALEQLRDVVKDAHADGTASFGELLDCAEGMLEAAEAREELFRDLADGLELEAMAETARLQEEMRVYREEHPRAAAIGVGEAGQREFAAWHRAFREERRARLVELIRRIRA